MLKKKIVSSRNGAGLSECPDQHVEECTQIHIYHYGQNKTPSGPNTSTRTRHTDTDKSETHWHRKQLSQQNTDSAET